MNFKTALQTCAQATQQHLTDAIDAMCAGQDTQTLYTAMKYAVNGGKGFRGFLVMESARLHDIHARQSVITAAAIEAMHAYSLVHDDLPCMDNDDMRRGMPTIHKKWDEATAVLVGDALQTLAFYLVGAHAHPDGAVRCALITSLAGAAGARGMVQGQMQDINAPVATRPLTLDDITHLQANKTGALFIWSAAAGAILAGADPTPLKAYAGALGLAFQITDDILDVEGYAATTGKAVGKDRSAGKATFVSLMGLNAAKAQAKTLTEHAIKALAPYGHKAELLKQAAYFVTTRDR